MDFFSECIIGKKKDLNDCLKILGIIVLAFIALMIMRFQIAGGFFPSLIPLELIGVVYGEYWLLSNCNVEYEYSVTNEYIDIDTIYAKSRRKRLLSVNAREFEYFAPYSGNHKNVCDNPQIKNRIDASGNKNADGVYFAILNAGGNKTCLIFRPNEKMVENFSKYVPRALYYTC